MENLPPTLARQIEELAPSATALEVNGFNWQTAIYLAHCISSGVTDLEELREHGLSQETAVAIATAISKRHERRATALAAVKSVAKPAPAVPAPASADQAAVRSLLHDLCLQIEAERGDADVLARAGFSWATATELAALINATRI